MNANKEFGNESSNGFWNRKISIWHFVYIILICSIFITGTLLIMPGRVNEAAYENFSFAATITSIVLAVVSIIYSIQSGLSNVGQLNTISEIESKISHEINNFSDIDKTIREAFIPIASQVGDIKQSQDNLHSEILKMSQFEIKENNKNIKIEGPVVLFVVLYAAARSYETKMDIPYHKFSEYVGVQSRYCEGLLDGIATFCSDKLRIEKGSRSTRKKVAVYDEQTFGSVDDLKKKVAAMQNTKLSIGLLNSIDEYYSDKTNQNAPDSVS